MPIDRANCVAIVWLILASVIIGAAWHYAPYAHASTDGQASSQPDSHRYWEAWDSHKHMGGRVNG